MIKIRFMVILIGFGMGLSFVAKAAGENKLKLKDLIEEALAKNPLGEAVKQEVLKTHAEIGLVGAYEDPVLAFEAKDYPVDTFSRNQYGMTGNEISLSQKIPFPGKLSNLKRSVSHMYESKKEELNERQLRIIKELKQIFYGLYVAYKRQALLIEQKNLVKQLIVITRNKYMLGKVTQAELLNFQTEEAQILGQILSTEKEINIKTNDLNYVLGRSDHRISGKPEDLKKTIIDFSKFTRAYFEKKVLEKNPSLKTVTARLKAVDEKLSYAKKGYLPDFEFMAAYTFREPSPGDRGIDFVSGRMGLTLPIWALTKQSEEIKQARAEKAQADAFLMEERNSLLRMIHSTYSELEEGSKRLNLYETGLIPLTKQAVGSGKKAYLSGRLEYLNLLNLIRNRFETEFGYYETLANYESKMAELEALSGEGMEVK